MSKKYNVSIDRSDLNKVKAELLKNIEGHAELQTILKSLNISKDIIKENLGLLSDYLDSLEEVKACKEAGKCLKHGEYHAYKLQVDGSFLSLTPESCPVAFNAQKGMMRYQFRDFPDEYLSLRIKDNPARHGFSGFLRELIAFYKGESHLVYVDAPSNIGVLRYAVSFMNQILDEKNDVSGAVVDYQILIREHASDYYKQKEELDTLLSQLTNVDYLVIHNFGNEEINKLVRDAFTFPLITERIKQKKPTIILSELSLNDIRYLHDYTGKDVRINQIIQAIKRNIKEEFTLKGTAL
ncbi:MAG: hypothetical protein RBS24_01630 [Bacilli bacterium]|nr:hypothetical protein [Bacilli bacterium]